MTKQLARRFYQTLNSACQQRSPYDSPTRTLDHLIRDSPMLWAEVKRVVTYEWGIRMVTARYKATPPQSNANVDQLSLFE
jgi:hypothetical protein